VPTPKIAIGTTGKAFVLIRSSKNGWANLSTLDKKPRFFRFLGDEPYRTCPLMDAFDTVPMTFVYGGFPALFLAYPGLWGSKKALDRFSSLVQARLGSMRSGTSYPIMRLSHMSADQEAKFRQPTDREWARLFSAVAENDALAEIVDAQLGREAATIQSSYPSDQQAHRLKSILRGWCRSNLTRFIGKETLAQLNKMSVSYHDLIHP